MQLDQAFAPAKLRVAAKVLDGELTIINLENGLYYASSGSGVTIWQQIEQHASLRQVIDQLISSYDVAPDRAEHDARAFLQKLAAEDLLEPSTAGAARPEDRASRLPYAPPQLDKFDDMAEQFALDPPLLVKSRG